MLNTKSLTTSSIVEIGVEGYPDRWFIQVYDTKECDPSYTFHTPFKAMDSTTDLQELPESIAQILASERTAGYS